MAMVWIPSLMRDLTLGQSQFDAPGKTVGEVIAALDAAYAGIQGRLCRGEEIDPALSVWVDGRIAPLGLVQAVEEQSEIQFLPAVAGG
jgi:molybdopterin converting factor small subunit